MLHLIQNTCDEYDSAQLVASLCTKEFYKASLYAVPLNGSYHGVCTTLYTSTTTTATATTITANSTTITTTTTNNNKFNSSSGSSSSSSSNNLQYNFEQEYCSTPTRI